MKRFVPAAVLLLFVAALGGGAQQVERRVGKLENRVGKVEERVDTIESSGGRNSAAADKAALKVQPLRVVLLSKKQSITGKQAGIRLALEFENLTNYSLNGFSGKLVFKPDSGGIYFRKIAYSHFVRPGGKARIVFTIGSDDTKSYLKFVKANAVRVVFVDQRLF
jgi:hypothetical protein